VTGTCSVSVISFQLRPSALNRAFGFWLCGASAAQGLYESKDGGAYLRTTAVVPAREPPACGSPPRCAGWRPEPTTQTLLSGRQRSSVTRRGRLRCTDDDTQTWYEVGEGL
jgi:hypothetical protein